MSNVEGREKVEDLIECRQIVQTCSCTINNTHSNVLVVGRSGNFSNNKRRERLEQSLGKDRMYKQIGQY